ILVLAIGVIMVFLGGSKMQIFAIGFAAIVVFGIYAAASGYLKDYMGERIEVWQKLLKNEELTDKEVQTEGWQILQSLYAIGSGGAFGMGFGKSNQKHLYLPEPQNDFIYAIVCEELGFIRAVIIMLLFVLLVLRGIHIALRCKSRFAALLTLGISFQIGLEAGLNMAVVTGTVPNTGISLPFFSYGGSAMLMLLTEMGMILSVSRSIEKKPAKGIVINEQS
ncbi:MAG: FtsW/RodA/SpoVE family cell cycle protein, partial [Clostridia bacterium]|nr:FtsW/RodA/SpoVE family cell cycle protein [Clostridia bacterium]